MITLYDWLGALQSTSWATAIREGDLLFPIIESTHVLAITLVVGTVSMVDMRLLGMTNRRRAVSQLTTDVLPWTWGAFVVAAISGALMFSSAALKYVDNVPFRIKVVMLALAGANMAYFHVVTQRSIAHWDEHPVTPISAKIAGGLSLLFWFGVIAAGRWIGFVTTDAF